MTGFGALLVNHPVSDILDWGGGEVSQLTVQGKVVVSTSFLGFDVARVSCEPSPRLARCGNINQ